MKGPPWTPREDAILRSLYEAGRSAAVAKRTGRSLLAVFHRARILRLSTHRRWTTDDDRRLRNIWGEYTLCGVARKLNRTKLATFQHAKEIGLQLGCPAGGEYLYHSAVRTGYSISTLRMILDRSEVSIRRTMSRPPTGKRWTGRERPCHFVDPGEVDEAIAAWLKTEPLHSAAKRRGVDAKALAKRLASVPGVPPKPEGKQHWRIPSEVIDRAMGVAA